MRHGRGRARLLERVRAGDGLVLVGLCDDARHRRKGTHLDLEEARADRLPAQTSIRNGELIAVAEFAGGIIPHEQGLQSAQGLLLPMTHPFEHLSLAVFQILGEIVADARHRQRMRVRHANL